MSRVGLKWRLVIAVTALSVVTILAAAALSERSQRSQAVDEMLGTARVLSQQMSATWEFIDINQDLIDTDSDGTYNFKGIYCAIAGKAIAKLFTKKSGYETRPAASSA